MSCPRLVPRLWIVIGMEIGHHRPGDLYLLYTDSSQAFLFENLVVSHLSEVGQVGWVGECLVLQLETEGPRTEQLVLCS